MSIRDDMLALIQGPPMDEYDRGVSDALTVFEAAHAKELDTSPEPQTEPTDDERVVRATIHGNVDAIRALDRLLRLPAPLEPSAEDSLSHYTDPTDPFWQSNPEPQTEPTDAQVLVALNAWYAKEREQNGWPIGSNAAELADYSPQTQDRMRAALRAALAEQSVKVVCSCPCHTTVGYKHIANCC